MPLPCSEQAEKIFNDAYKASFEFWIARGSSAEEAHNYAHSSALLALSEMPKNGRPISRLEAITEGMKPDDPRRSIAVALANNMKFTIDRCRDILGRMSTVEGRA